MLNAATEAELISRFFQEEKAATGKIHDQTKAREHLQKCKRRTREARDQHERGKQEKKGREKATGRGGDLAGKEPLEGDVVVGGGNERTWRLKRRRFDSK